MQRLSLKQFDIKILAVMLATMLAVMPITTAGTGKFSPNLPMGSAGLNAAVTIKTQKAANSIQGGIRGIDVSKWQGVINWQKVATDDVKFVFARASIGTAIDPTFVANATGAHENGLKVGAYHYATFSNTTEMKEQAALFLSMLKQVKITYPVVLDIETHKGIKRSALTKLATQFMEIVSAKGYKVMLYSYSNFFRDYLDLNTLQNHDLWVANYLEQPNQINHKMWQHTASGKVNGIKGNVDINIAYTDLLPVKKITADASAASVEDVFQSRYGVYIPENGDISEVSYCVAAAIQQEVNSQWGKDLAVDGFLDDEAFSCLQTIKFTNKTKGYITYILQTKLLYLGYYQSNPTSRFDDETVSAIADFQQEQGIEQTGSFDPDTMYALLLY